MSSYKYVKELESFDIMQEKLNDLSDENFDETLAFFANSSFLNSPENNYSDFIDNLLLFVSIRTKKIELYARLLQQISLIVDQEIIMHLISYNSSYKEYLNYGYFLRKCYELKIYDMCTIQSYVFNPNQFYDFDNVAKTCSIFFAQEIKPELSLLLKNNGFNIDIDDYPKYNGFFCPTDSIENIIYHDDIYNFQIVSAANFDFEQPIDTIAYQRISLLDLAAMYGSPLCFKFIMMNSKLSLHQNSLVTQYSAIQGGSLEIIRIIKDKLNDFYTVSPSNIINHAIIYHQNDVIKWLLDFYGTKTINDQIIDLYKTSISFNNYEMFLYFINYFPSILKKKSDLFIYSCRLNNNNFINFFVENKIIPRTFSCSEEELIVGTKNMKAISLISNSNLEVPFLTLAIKNGYSSQQIAEFISEFHLTFPDHIFHDVVKYAKTDVRGLLEFLHDKAPPNLRNRKEKLSNYRHQIRCNPFETSIYVHNEEAINFFLENPEDYIFCDESSKDVMLEFINTYFSNFVNLYNTFSKIPGFNQTLGELNPQQKHALYEKLNSYHIPTPLPQRTSSTNGEFSKFDDLPLFDVYGS